MATFNPQAAVEESELTSGAYDVTLAYVTQKVGKASGQPYYSMKYTVDDDAAGREFWCVLSCQVGKGPVAKSWGEICAAAGIADAFDVDDDNRVRRLFEGKKFRVNITIKKDGEYENVNINKWSAGTVESSALDDGDDEHGNIDF